MNFVNVIICLGLSIMCIGVCGSFCSKLNNRLEKIENILNIKPPSKDKNCFNSTGHRIEVLEMQMGLVLEEIGKINKEKK